MNRKRKRNFLYALLSTAVCLVIYLAIGFVIIGLPQEERRVDDNISVVDERGEDFSVLLACDELSHYAALYAEPAENRLTLTLFSSLATAEGFGFHYDRTVKYDKKTEINLIGRLGGIVIGENICYNDSNYEHEKDKQRLFGAAAIELSCESPEKRADIANELLFSLLECDLSGEDFSYFLSLAETDISYSDCYRNYAVLQRLKYSITVQTVD